MDDGICRVKKELLSQLSNCDVSISHQITNGKNYMYKFDSNIIYNSMNLKGLSKNRNNALKYAKSDICIICDDDLNYVKNFEKIIAKAYAENPLADVITFQAVDEYGNFHGKIYDKTFKHNKKTILGVTSSMVTFRKSSLGKNGLKFDENFGLGTKWCIGEENILLNDCLNKNLTVLSYNRSIVIHPIESSGIDYRDELVKSRPVVFYRLFGFMGVVLFLMYFPIFHYKFYSVKYSIYNFLKLSCVGLREYFGEQK
jgi:glycosyltransferase involved in cell wall biosynthesis